MAAFNRHLKSVLSSCVAASFLLGSLAAGAQPRPDDSVSELIDGLAEADTSEARQIVRELELIWSRSGSPAMDLLLRKGRDAMETGDLDEAVGHLTALVDHAPDFAEGRHLRAMVFFRQEEFGMAQSDLEHVLALNPMQFQAAYGLAAIMEQTGRIDAALAGYEAVLDLYPAHEQARAGRDRLAPRASGSDI